MIVRRFYTTPDCIRHWITLSIPHWIPPEPVQAALACGRALAVVGGLAALPGAPTAIEQPAPVFDQPTAYAPYGDTGYGAGFGGAYETAGGGVAPPIVQTSPGLGVRPSEEAGDTTGGAETLVPPVTSVAAGGYPAPILTMPDTAAFGPDTPDQVQPVPEPSSLAVLAVGLVVVWLAGLGWRR